MYSRILRFLSLIMIIVTLLMITPMIVIGFESVKSDNLSKINDNVWESEPDIDGYRWVSVVRNRIPTDVIEKTFFDNYGFSMANYTDKQIYENKTIPSIATKYLEVANAKKSSSPNTVESTDVELIKNTPDFKLALSDDYNAFIKKQRDVLSDLYEKYNENFILKHSISLDAISYIGVFEGTITLKATEDQIKSLASDEEVISITLWNNVEYDTHLSNVNAQINTDDIVGIKSSAYNNGNGYDGTGVKIGIIEAKGGRFDPNAPQLKSIAGTQLKFVENSYNGTTVETEVSPHATFVTSVLVGQKYTLNGKTYEGIAPNATVYQMAIRNQADLRNAINTLVDVYGVTIINLSGGSNASDTAYDIDDQMVDYLSLDLGVTFVISAGNTSASNPNLIGVNSPGKAYNAITVGNAYTESDSEAKLTPPYAVYESSLYAEKSYLSNKPDIVAPGSIIHFARWEYESFGSTGTSISAPIVAGVIAQMQQANNLMRFKSTEAKALLLAGADRELIYDDYDNTRLLGEKCGAGLVNAVDTIENFLNNQIITYTFDLYNAMIPSSYTKTVSLTAGQKIKIVMTYNKPDQYILTEKYANNLNLYLFAPNGSQVAYSMSTINNVEVIEYTAATSGTYTIRTILESKDLQSTEVVYASVAWEIDDGSVRAIYNANGGVCSSYSKKVYTGSSYGTLSTPTRSGYTFVGWFTTPSAEGSEVKSTTTVAKTENHVLYAHWARKYKITNVGANKCLNIYGDNVTSLTNGTNVTLWSDSGTNEQLWYITGLGSTRFVRSTIDKTFGLNVYRSGDPYNCNVYKIIGNETDAQIDFIQVDGGYKIKLHNYNLYLTASSSANGANVYWDEESTSNYQVWKFTLVS